MKRWKKIIIIVIITLLLISIGSLIYFTTDNNNDPKELSNQKIEENIKNLTRAIMNGGTEEQLVKTTGNEAILDSLIMTGEDMYLRKTPEDYIQDEYPLDEYITLSKTLANNLEQKIKDNFNYRVVSISKDGNDTLITVSYKTFYYNAYINDLNKIIDNLLTRKGYNLNTVIKSDKLIADTYKAKIKAALILNDRLDNYINNNEYLESTFIYESNNYLMSYFYALTGYYYDNKGYLNKDEDVNNILLNYDLTDPLKV